jgi:hypothetical protein
LERAFSILNDCIDEDQYSAFADYKEAMVMAQYNARGRLLAKAEIGHTESRALPSYSGAWGEFYCVYNCGVPASASSFKKTAISSQVTISSRGVGVLVIF